MKAVAAAVKELSAQQIAAFERDGAITLDIDGTPATIDLADVEIISEDIPGWLVANDGALTIALDIEITPEMRREGIAREIVNRVQNIRKDRDYNITDRILLTFAPNDATDDAIREYADYISRQVLANSLDIAPVAEGDGTERLDIDGILLDVKITKA